MMFCRNKAVLRRSHILSQQCSQSILALKKRKAPKTAVQPGKKKAQGKEKEDVLCDQTINYKQLLPSHLSCPLGGNINK